MFFWLGIDTFASVIEQSVIDDVLARVDLSDFIGETVELVQRSGNHEGLCPFHSEKTPSFKVFADHYRCFGCQAHGNAIAFAMEKFGMPFPEALRLLASRVGVELKAEKVNLAPDPLAAERDVLRRACAKYQQLLLADASAMAELATRGIEDDAIIRFGIGFAPDAWGTLTDDRLFKWDKLLATGLAVQRREKKGCYDFFRNRILFPVRDEGGDVIGFGGRRIGEDGPKYLNTPETALYQKGRELFGLPQARASIRMSRAVIVAEGFFDVMVPSQAGIENIVSTCGTALTDEQIELILSLADRVFLCFDGDAAGAKATWRAAEMLVPLVTDQHEIRLCRLPEGEDPDSFVRKFGSDRFREVLDGAPTLAAYLVGELTRGARIPEARARAMTMAVSLWRRFSAPGMGVFFKQYLCESLQLSSDEFARLSGSTPTRSGDSALRACPCCGGAADSENLADGHRIACLQCGLSTPSLATCEEARFRWNRRERTKPKPVPTKT